MRANDLNALLAKVDQNGPLPTWAPFLGPCWIWQRGLGRRGYGKATYQDRTVAAHRIIYELLVGPIPDGLHLDHLCRVHACVNPAHLEPVTCRENVVRGIGPSALNAAKDECDAGHPFDADNTYVTPDGRRQCRACNRDRCAKYRRKAAA